MVGKNALKKLYSISYIILLGSTPEISPASIAWDVQNSYALKTWQGDILPITLQCTKYYFI